MTDVIRIPADVVAIRVRECRQQRDESGNDEVSGTSGGQNPGGENPGGRNARNVRGVSARRRLGLKLRVAAYCRVSTEHDEQVESLENQVDYYTRYIKEHADYELADIFADQGISGTGTKKRVGFQAMIEACESGRVDLVVTKSISRFARNTADCLYFSRRLREMGIPIVFEKESINTMEASGEFLFTILSSIAQEESRNISENTQWGIRSRFRQGIPHLNTVRFMGYDRSADGSLVIDEKQAETVRFIFEKYLNGWSEPEIAEALKKRGDAGVTGRCVWTGVTVSRMLQNEKYKGDILMQKYYTVDYLTRTQAQNTGALDQYYVQNAHPAIVSGEMWDAAQGSICGAAQGSICGAVPAAEEKLFQTFVETWNRICENRENLIAGWEKTMKEGNALQSYHAQQMKKLSARRTDRQHCEELIRMVVEEITIGGEGEAEIHFRDGTCILTKMPSPTLDHFR